MRRSVYMTNRHKKHLSNTANGTKLINITRNMYRGGYRL